MKCPHCKKQISNEMIAKNLGAKGGSAKNPNKGFGNPEALKKALATRKANKARKHNM